MSITYKVDDLIRDCVVNNNQQSQQWINVSGVISQRIYLEVYVGWCSWMCLQYEAHRSFDVSPFGYIIFPSGPSSSFQIRSPPQFGMGRNILTQTSLNTKHSLAPDTLDTVKFDPQQLNQFCPNIDSKKFVTTLNNIISQISYLFSNPPSSLKLDFKFGLLTFQNNEFQFNIKQIVEFENETRNLISSKTVSKQSNNEQQKNLLRKKYPIKPKVEAHQINQSLTLHPSHPHPDLIPPSFIHSSFLSPEQLPSLSLNLPQGGKINSSAINILFDTPSQRLPPVLDDFSRTRAATYLHQTSHLGISAKIASFYSPKLCKFSIAPKKKGVIKSGTVPFDEKDVENIISSKEEKEKSWERYFQYITSGIDSSHIEPLKDEVIGLILENLAVNQDILLLESSHILIDQMITEIRQDHLTAIKRAILDYILLNYKERSRLHILFPPNTLYRPHIFNSTINWRERIQQSWLYLNEHLHSITESHVHLAQLWSKYSHLSLVVVPDFKKPLLDYPQSLSQFISNQESHITEVRTLFYQWIEECKEVVHQYLVSHTLSNEQYSSYFNSVAVLMGNMLHSIINNSLDDFLSLFQRYQVKMSEEEMTEIQKRSSSNDKEDSNSIFHYFCPSTAPFSPIFFVDFVIESKNNGNDPFITYSISTTSFVEQISHHFDYIYKALDGLPRVESLLFSQININPLNIPLDFEKIDLKKSQILTLFQQSIENVENLSSIYQPFQYILTEKANIEKKLGISADSDHQEDINDSQIQNENINYRQLNNLEKEIIKYRKLSNSIQDKALSSFRAHMIAINSREINSQLSNHLQNICEAIIIYITQTCQEKTLSLDTQFKHIKEKLIAHPGDPLKIKNLDEFLEEVRSSTRSKLVYQCEEIKKYLNFLLDQENIENKESLSEKLKSLLTQIDNTFKIGKKLDDHIEQAENNLQTQTAHQIEELTKSYKNLSHRIDEVSSKVAELRTYHQVTNVNKYKEMINSINEELKHLEAEIDKHHRVQNNLKLENTDFSLLYETKKRLKPYEELWELFNNTQINKQKWYRNCVFFLDPEAVEKTVDETIALSTRLSKTLKEDCQISDDNTSESKKSPVDVAEYIKKSVLEFKPNIPLIKVLCNKGMQEKHWKEIRKVVGCDINPDKHSYLKLFLEYGLARHVEKLQAISNAATQEWLIEKQLEKIQEDWSQYLFPIEKYESGHSYIIKSDGLDTIQNQIDDHMIKIHVMSSNPYSVDARNKIQNRKLWLLKTQDILDECVKVQSVWLYLSPIFSSRDITTQLPYESEKFKKADKNWREIMENINKNPLVNDVVNIPGILPTFIESSADLDIVQKGLNSYLDTKRRAFPRFYFLSDKELLEILSETKDPLLVQPHLNKCFLGIESLFFQDNFDITKMISSENETIDLVTIVNPIDNEVENWLSQIESSMRQTIQDLMYKGYTDYQRNVREKWVVSWPSQIVHTISQIYWTQQVSSAIINGHLKELFKDHKIQIENIVKIIRGELTNIQRNILGNLLIIDVHANNVIQDLIDNNVESIDDFEWVSQLRYYLTDDNIIKIHMLSHSEFYGYEYLGCQSRLVITPLTDRCYRTLMSALQFNLGGAPEGPAGTGKTETVKDLAKAVAIQCVVFNCSRGLNITTMGQFFKGLASAGAWSCFDEFNFIELSVLSVISQQIHTIQQAKFQKLDMFEFEGNNIPLKQSCSIFITMNPGYAGRSELPDNLKAKFRPVAMMVPDYALISEISLYSFGFIEARNLSAKIVATFRLCSELLSSQYHYDYGMRAVKAVISAAGELKRKYPKESENELLLRSIHDVNLPKFLSHDVPLFKGIVHDLFPQTELPVQNYGPLIRAINQSFEKFNLQPVQEIVEKIIQLYESLIVRHGVMIVGPPFSGKSSCYRILAHSLNLLAKENQMSENGVIFQVINPKAVTWGQLYGEYDEVCLEWHDGVLSKTFRNYSMDTSPQHKWIILDGPVDALWIESMNTVLDDNKKLCLQSAMVIPMSSTMKMLFEVGDLSYASPATVSRCGMVYMETESLGWKPLVASWLNVISTHYPELDTVSIIKELFDFLIPPMLLFIKKHCTLHFPLTDANLLQSTINIFNSLLDKWVTERNFDNLDELTAIEMIFLFSLVWGVGSCVVDITGRERFSKQLRRIVSDPSASYNIHTPFPTQETVFNYCIDFKINVWKQWSIPETKVPIGTLPQKVVVNTIDTTRYSFLLELLIKQHKMCLFVGLTGTGKSLYIQNSLAYIDKTKYSQLSMVFSARTTANIVQNIIEGSKKIDRRRKGVYGPPHGKNLILFIDDLNMPSVEEYGAQPPIEFLRQWADHVGWYDLNENVFKNIVDVQLISAMAPPGGGRNPITERFLRHFNQISIVQASENTLLHIFTYIMQWHMNYNKFEENIQNLSETIVRATKDIFFNACSGLLPCPSKSHYTFNLRDFSRVIQGMCLMKKPNFTTTEKVIRLWIHEVHRVFSDRLSDDSDCINFLKWVHNTVEMHFETSFDELMSQYDINKDGRVDTLDEIRLLQFGDILDQKGNYDELTNLIPVTQVWKSHLEDYNNMSERRMPLVLFQFAIEHLSRLSRIFKQAGHTLLVGLGGSGRQSLTKLAAYVCHCDIQSIELKNSYGITEWHDDIKKILIRAGVQCLHTVFLLTDSHIKHPLFLEDINNLLNSGEVPNLFFGEEKTDLLEKIRVVPKPSLLKPPETPDELYSYFVNCVKDNLHLVICMSPAGDEFRNRLRNFPSLVNCCTIDWFHPWPSEGLRSVASDFLNNIEMDERVRENCIHLCMQMHLDSSNLVQQYYNEQKRRTYITPISYLDLLFTFNSLLAEKRRDVAASKSRYTKGYDRLLATKKDVQNMQQNLQDLQPKLEETVKETETLIGQVAKENDSVKLVRINIEKDEFAANQQAEDAKALKLECDKELKEVLPMLHAAEESLNLLTPQQIAAFKALKHPPPSVKLVAHCLCIMFDIKPQRIQDQATSRVTLDYWASSTKELFNTHFLKNLLEYPHKEEKISHDILKQVKQFIDDPEFQSEKVAIASKEAATLVKWVHAIYKYNEVLKEVLPKQAKQELAENIFKEKKKNLEIKQAELSLIQDKLDKLEQKLQHHMESKLDLENEKETVSIKMGRAQQLLKELGGENVRWNQQSQHLGDIYKNLTGDTLISSGFVAYLGPFSKLYREKMVKKWYNESKQRNIPCSNDFSIINTLGDPVLIRSWCINGLPRDNTSIDNAIIMEKSRRWPLFIDPFNQAISWIKANEKDNKQDLLICLKLNSDRFNQNLETAISAGMKVLIENVGEEIDPILDPLLQKQTYTNPQGNLSIKIFDKEIPYSRNFRLYMTTKLRNPHYLPEICTKVVILNFQITLEGLEDQLLGIVVFKEKPELEEEKNRLIVTSAENKKKLKDIEEEILLILSRSGINNILDDESAINMLSQSKSLSVDIEEKQEVSEKTEIEIDQRRKEYRSVATLSSIAFFVIQDLGNIEPTYQYSLSWFIKLFENSIKEAKESNILNERLENIKSNFTQSLYHTVCISLFEKDKLLFPFLLTTRILASEQQIDIRDFNFLLTGGISVESKYPTNPAPYWLPEHSWQNLCRLETLPSFNFFTEDFTTNISKWQQIYERSNYQNIEIPGKWQILLSPFQKILIFRCFRPDFVVPMIREFVKTHLGDKFIEAPVLDLDSIYKESTVDTPFVFVLSPGCDPMAHLSEFANKHNKVLHGVSLGKGQEQRALSIIHSSINDGSWVVLQNCHLATNFLISIEKLFETFHSHAPHDEFRLWITSYPSHDFPVGLLQNSIKITSEAPKGLRINIFNSYLSHPLSDAKYLESVKHPLFKKMVFALCFFHAVILERKTFGSLGWNIPYQFSDGDRLISLEELNFLLSKSSNDNLPLKDLIYLIAECNYGGRVTDNWDRRTLKTCLSDIFCEQISDPNFSIIKKQNFIIPTSLPHSSYLSFIRNKISLATDPLLLGMHPNADITRCQNEAFDMFESLLFVQSQSFSDSGKKQEEFLDDISADISSRIPNVFDIETVARLYPTSNQRESLNQVLVQECMRYNRLIVVIRSSLTNLKNALIGLVVMSREVEVMGNEMMKGKVPKLWLEKSYPSLKPLTSYISDFIQRLKFYQDWINIGPPVIWCLPNFFFTHSFLTALLQNYSRKQGIAIDEVAFDFEFPIEKPTSAPIDGAYISGLFIEGARWDNDTNMLAESHPKVLYSPAPLIWLKPRRIDDIVPYPSYICPLYRTSSRRGTLSTTGHSTNFIVSIKMPTNIESSHWIKRGVALLCETPY